MSASNAIRLWAQNAPNASLAVPFTLPTGFTIEVAVGADLAPRPIACDFDEKGRLYVTDSSGSNEKTAIQVNTKPHRIVRLGGRHLHGKLSSEAPRGRSGATKIGQAGAGDGVIGLPESTRAFHACDRDTFSGGQPGTFGGSKR